MSGNGVFKVLEIEDVQGVGKLCNAGFGVGVAVGSISDEVVDPDVVIDVLVEMHLARSALQRFITTENDQRSVTYCCNCKLLKNSPRLSVTARKNTFMIYKY